MVQATDLHSRPSKPEGQRLRRARLFKWLIWLMEPEQKVVETPTMEAFIPTPKGRVGSSACYSIISSNHFFELS
jgi:hypothetical protein